MTDFSPLPRGRAKQVTLTSPLEYWRNKFMPVELRHTHPDRLNHLTWGRVQDHHGTVRG